MHRGDICTGQFFIAFGFFHCLKTLSYDSYPLLKLVPIIFFVDKFRIGSAGSYIFRIDGTIRIGFFLI